MKGVLADVMYLETSVKSEAYHSPTLDTWTDYRDKDFVNQAGWYFKTVAAQIPGIGGINYLLFLYTSNKTSHWQTLFAIFFLFSIFGFLLSRQTESC